mgnify:CR=1 FL=1
MELRPYQRECLESILAGYRRGLRRVLVSLPTGTGKTVVFANLPKFLKMKRRMLMIAHRQELLDQAAAKFAASVPDLSIGIEQASRSAPPDCRIVLASVPTVGRQGSTRLLELPPEDFYLIVVDEAHHAVAASYRRIFDHFGLFAEDSKRLLVGFTATPRRGDKHALSSVFQEVAYAKNLPEMVRAGYLCPLRGWRVSTPISLGSVASRHGDFVESELASLVDVPERNQLVVNAYQELAAGRRAVVFCVNVAHVLALAAAFQEAGIRTAPIWGAMSREDRQSVLQAFHQGELEVLTNCNVLTEGFDEPRVDCVVMARPTQSQLLYAQMVGRGTRLHQHKSDLIVIDIVDNSSRHKLAGLNALFDLPEDLDLAGHSAIHTVDALERLSQEAPWIDFSRVDSAAELELVTQRVDLFRFEPPAEIADLTDFAWCGLPDGGYRLNLTDGEWVGVRQDDLGRWQAILHTPGVAPQPGPVNPTLPKAIRTVDRFVKDKRPDLVSVLKIDADWREQRPSDKQLDLLRRRNIPIASNLTRGQASWLITHSSMRRTKGSF